MHARRDDTGRKSSADFAVRDATTADAAVVAGLIHALADAGEEESPVTADYVVGYMALAGVGALLAEADGHAVGLLTYHFHPGLFHAGAYAVIDEVIVRPEAQRTGVGDALMSEVMRRIEAAGCAQASVATGMTNSAAQSLYRKHGLVEEALLLEKHFD